MFSFVTSGVLYQVSVAYRKDFLSCVLEITSHQRKSKRDSFESLEMSRTLNNLATIFLIYFPITNLLYAFMMKMKFAREFAVGMLVKSIKQYK